ncbi:PA2169 family four-helix-bundle protein [Ascidiimonas aurantiaca]|uniref:ferritin-like domain-containing protein n=1 Tax=Ascidiimonas aurantiaca TaxID=1685432 RepID=UPI0030EC90E3
MNTYTEKISNQLNMLIEKNLDAEKGFKKAAENVNNTALKKFFESCSHERSVFAQQLKNEVATYGQDSTDNDSYVSKAHRTWMDVKAFFSGNKEEAILEEVIRGEKAALEEYNEVLEENNLPTTTREILNAQRIKIKNSLASVLKMEDIA